MFDHLELLNDGGLYRLPSEPQIYADRDKFTVVGVGVADDAMLLFGPQHVRDQFGTVISASGNSLLGWGQWETG